MDETEEDVLRANVVVIEHPGFFLRQDNNPPRSVGKPLEHVVALLTARGRDGVLMGRALPCLLRIVAACPRSRLMRVCASHTSRSLDTGRSSSSNPLDEAHVPSTAAGTPQANGLSRRPPDRPVMLGAPPRRPARPLAAPPGGQTHRWPLDD